MAIELESTPGPARAAAPARPAARRAALRARDRTFLLERLSLLLAAGNPLHESLAVLARQATSPRLAAILERLRDDIERGMPFSRALARQPEAFPATHASLVAAAEDGGFLPEVLGHLAGMEERNAELRSTVVSAFTYPAFLVVFSALVVVFVLAVVFPRFAVMFASIAGDLPATTRALMAASDLLTRHWPWLLGAAAAAGVAAERWRRSVAGRAAISRLAVSLPGLRGLFTTWYAVQFLRVMGLSLGHGVSVPEALRASRDVAGNAAFRRFVESLEASVQEGRGIGPAVERTRMLPELARQMIQAAEHGGNLAPTLDHLAAYYERELNRWLRAVSRLIEPVMLLVMGVVVGLVVSSLILPIFKLARAVH